MNKKIVVVAHGIGDTKKGFEKEWAKVLYQNHGNARFEVRGLHWEDQLEKIRERYGKLSKGAQKLLETFELGNLSSKLEKVGESEAYKKVMDYVHDIVLYAGLPEMARAIEEKCKERLRELVEDQDYNTILIGHSLGAAILPRIVWQQKMESQYIAYKGMILLASPLGFDSPLPDIAPDLLRTMTNSRLKTRKAVVKHFAAMWDNMGMNKFRFIINTNDLVCSDVIYYDSKGNKIGDIICLVRQSFSPDEIETMDKAHAGCVIQTTWGQPTLKSISHNHDAKQYLNCQAFRDAFEALLSQ